MNIWLKRLRSFMNTDAEWHAFVIGWGDGVTFRRTDLSRIREIEGEVHYYKFGLALGLFSIIGFITAMVDIFI